MGHQRFHYKSLEDVENTIKETGVWIPLSNDFSCLFQPLKIGPLTAANRFVIQPMEGCDADGSGAPGELCFRRYQRFAHGGAAILWFESIAIVSEGRATSHELMISKDNIDLYKRLLDGIRETCLRDNGYTQIILPQLTHSGRFCNPSGGKKEPLAAAHNPLFEKDAPLPDSCIVTDDYLRNLEDKYGETAALCERAGFDGVDMKACHGYLVEELISAPDRQGMYGGSIENRSRFLVNATKAVRENTSSKFIIGIRMNAFDNLPYPYGFGSIPGCDEPDYTPATRIASLMNDKFAVKLLNISCGIGYINPHVLRPYDNGTYIPNEHPFAGLSRHTKATAAIKAAFPSNVVVGSAYSYLRQFSPYSAAGMIKKGYMDMAGFGRMAFAYPDFIRDLRNNGAIEIKKCCITCGQCIIRLRSGLTAGCVIRDKEIYKPYRA